jgi:hypothetical protein
MEASAPAWHCAGRGLSSTSEGGELVQADTDEAAVAFTAAMVAATGRKCGIVFALLQGPPRQR